MKNRLKFAFGILFAFIILFANVSAHDLNSRFPVGRDDGVILIVQDRNDYYDKYGLENEDRYPVYDYRWGYSYRASDEYRNDRMEREYEDRYNYDYENNYGYRNYYYEDAPSVKYVYSDYMRSYQRIECYNYPPRDKFFYIKC